MSHVYITGAAGFIGSYVTISLLQRGWKVTAVDSLLTGSISNFGEWLQHPLLDWHIADVTDTLPASRHEAIDVVLHLACPASPKDYLAYPIETMKVDSIGTFATLDLARAHGARYILASTSEIYGDPLVHPQEESYWGNVNPIGIRSVYNEAKRFSEALTMAYHREYGLETVILRMFNTYGPRMKPGDGRIIPNFIMQALAGVPLTVYGDGEQTRSFCYIDDTVAGIQRAVTLPDLGGEVINLGNPEEYSVNAVADRIITMTGSSSEGVHIPAAPDDPRQRKPDIRKAKRLLNWEPVTPLEEGLWNTIADFRRIHKEQ